MPTDPHQPGRARGAWPVQGEGPVETDGETDRQGQTGRRLRSGDPAWAIFSPLGPPLPGREGSSPLLQPRSTSRTPASRAALPSVCSL